MNLDSTKTQIILAAVGAAGVTVDHPEFNDRLAEAAARITAMLSEASPVSRAIDQVAASRCFVAVIAGIRREESSTRAVVELHTRPTELHPDGIEAARSERTDHPSGLAMARRLQGLRGHKVMLWIESESIGGGSRSVRVIRHVEDLGVEKAEPVETHMREAS